MNPRESQLRALYMACGILSEVPEDRGDVDELFGRSMLSILVLVPVESRQPWFMDVACLWSGVANRLPTNAGWWAYVRENCIGGTPTRLDRLIADCANETADIQDVADGIVDHVPGGWTAITAALVGAHEEFSRE